MKLGLSLPQGCDREYLGVDPATAWRRTVEVARWAEDLGFESLWINDHMQVDPPPEEAIDLRAVRRAGGAGGRDAPGAARPPRPQRVATATRASPRRRSRRSTSISGGRAILGIGAGWKEDEWLAYGYGFPPAPERLAVLADQLEIITRMLGPGRATWDGHARERPRRDPRAEGPAAAADPDPRRGQRAEGDLAAGGAVRGRAEPRRADPGTDRGGPAGDPRALRGGRPGRRERWPSPSSSGARRPTSPPGPERRQRFRDYEGLGLARVIVQGFALVKDPHVIDDVIDDAVAVGLLSGAAVAQA